MKSLMLAVMLIPSLSSFAATTPRQQCLAAGLETQYDDSGEEVDNLTQTYGRNIARMSEAQISALPAMVKRQLIFLAQSSISEGYRDFEGRELCKRRENVRTVNDAVECLRQFNESRDEEIYYAYVSSRVNGARFNMITFYPGAQVGLIFADGTTTVVADINDGDPACVK
jgi:hypothetical protein